MLFTIEILAVKETKYTATIDANDYKHAMLISNNMKLDTFPSVENRSENITAIRIIKA